MNETVITHSPNETEEVGFRVATKLKENHIHAHIRLYGEMGVGKTAFVRGFCRALGISGVKSPTYTMVNEYRGECRVYHFDMVRISSEEDLYSIGFDDYTADEGAYLLFEWTENIDEYLSEGGIFVTISRVAENESAREIEIRLGDGYTV